MVAVLVSMLVMLGPFTSNVVIPSLPAITKSFQTDFADTQLLLSVYMAGFAIGQLFVGPLSDRFGRKPVLCLSLLICTLASAGGALAPDLATLIMARLFQAVGLSATLSVGRAVIRDVFPSEHVARIYAYVGTALALGPILGPVMGGFVEVAAGWRMVFWCMAVIGSVMLVIILVLLRETNAQPDPLALRLTLLIRNYRQLLGSPRYLGYTLCNALAYGGIFAFASCSSFVLIDMLGITPDTFGLLFALTIGSYGGGTLVASQLTSRCGIDRMILMGGLIMTAAGLLLVVYHSMGILTAASVVGPFAIFAFGTGFVFPNGQAGAITPYPEKSGAASSMLSFVQMTLAAGVGILVTRLLDDTAGPLAWVTLLTGILLLICLYALVMRPASSGKRAG